jgi:hypothetical protein
MELDHTYLVGSYKDDRDALRCHRLSISARPPNDLFVDLATNDGVNAHKSHRLTALFSTSHLSFPRFVVSLPHKTLHRILTPPSLFTLFGLRTHL